jgi:hypothetical protein
MEVGRPGARFIGSQDRLVVFEWFFDRHCWLILCWSGSKSIWVVEMVLRVVDVDNVIVCMIAMRSASTVA